MLLWEYAYGEHILSLKSSTFEEVVSLTLKDTNNLLFKSWYQHTYDVCTFIAYYVAEFETVFRGVIFW